MSGTSSPREGADDSKSGTATASDLEDGSGLYADVSRAMVRLYKEQFGRGPVKAKTRFADPDTLLCTLEGSLTPDTGRDVSAEGF